MTHVISILSMILYASAFIIFIVASGVSAEVYMSSPTPRGIEHLDENIKLLQGPNLKGVCRNEPAGTDAHISKNVELKLTIEKSHTGLCQVYILDKNLSNARKVAEKQNCAASDLAGPWMVNLPSDVSGPKVLRWIMKADTTDHSIEYFEQCADVYVD